MVSWPWTSGWGGDIPTRPFIDALFESLPSRLGHRHIPFPVRRLRIRNMNQTVRRLQVLLSDRAEMTTILVDKLRGEVLNNIEHLSESAMLHDDAWRAIRPDDLKHLPRQIRNLSSGFYTDFAVGKSY
jgi:hypothetical protein